MILPAVKLAPGETAAETAARTFEVDIAGTRHAAVVLACPPHDPRGERMTA